MKNSDDIENIKSLKSSHIWRFIRIGGFDHVLLDTGNDLLALEKLDQKLWAVLSCPTNGLEFDSKTFQYMDTDEDGRIRAAEIISALKWTLSLINNPDDLIRSSPELPLASINDSSNEGKKILFCAREILKNIGKKSAEVITIEDTLDSSKIFANTKFNGDGIIPVIAADDESSQKIIQEIIDCFGAEQDRSGLPGINMEKVEIFFNEAIQYSDWWHESEKNASNILPFGDRTQKVYKIFEVIQAKIDDYFTRCSLAAFDNRSTLSLNPSNSQYDELSLKILSRSSKEISAFPISKIEQNNSLNLNEGINPAWIEIISKFREEIVRPLFKDKEIINANEWKFISTKFNDYRAWLSRKKESSVEKLGIKRIDEILSGNSKDIIKQLIEKDMALESEANSTEELNKLIYYYRDIYILLNNFISLRDFYTPGKKAIFQAGTLYLDGRSCDMCIRVDDIAKHSTLANLGRTYLAYCECSRKDSSQKIKIAAAFTEGDSDNLMVGRNGVFYDRKNRDWDATIVKIIEQPISIRQAFLSPYRRFARMITEQIEKVAVAREKAVDSGTSGTITDISQKAETGKPISSQPFDVGKFAGIFAAIGLAVGAIGTAIASVVTGFMSLEWWQMPLTVVGLIFAISGPSMVIAYLKLRQRNLSPILDACGWAVNTRAIINIPFGSSLTSRAILPEGSSRLLKDPFAEKERPWKFYIFIVTLLMILGLMLQKGIFHKLIDLIK
ncbi:MAG: hypothetical protein HQK79_08275 [Desulfobacterales bacterium]|nr:hypothetical protein [Desulfobacterales bacterium]